MIKIMVFLKLIFFILTLFLIVISSFPGSLVGLFYYGDINIQPYIINHPQGSAINHFITYFLLSIMGLSIYCRNENFQRIFYVLLALSVILEILQFVVPNRAFELYDLIGNFLGVLVAYFLIKIYLLFNKL